MDNKSIGTVFSMLEFICKAYNKDFKHELVKLNDYEHEIHFKSGMPYSKTYYYTALSRLITEYKREA